MTYSEVIEWYTYYSLYGFNDKVFYIEYFNKLYLELTDYLTLKTAEVLSSTRNITVGMFNLWTKKRNKYTKAKQFLPKRLIEKFYFDDDEEEREKKKYLAARSIIMSIQRHQKNQGLKQ